MTFDTSCFAETTRSRAQFAVRRIRLRPGSVRERLSYPLPAGSHGTFFWFFADGNVEQLVKVLNACGLPGFNNFWVFAAGLTNVEVTLTVTDVRTGQTKQYVNPIGVAYQPVQDTTDFRGCP